MIVIEGIDRVRMSQALTLRQALKLELLGLKGLWACHKRHDRSAYAIVKDTFGFKGNRKTVLDQLNQWIEQESQRLVDLVQK
jgi:hypothetical protein